MQPKLVFALALVVRLSLFLLSGPWKDDWPQRLTYTGDPFEYAVLGRSLLTRGEFSVTWPAPMPDALRLPVFPAFIALTSGGAQLDKLWLTILFQIVIDSAFAVFLIHCLSRLFRNESLGWIGGILYACSPDAVLWSTQLLAESISLWLIGGALYGLAAVNELAEGRSRGRFVVGVLCGALLPLCKPVWQYLWVLLIVWTVVAIFRNRTRPALGWLIAGALVMVVPGVIWMKRNYDAWEIFSLSVSKPYVQRESAKGILIWAGTEAKESAPDYTYEMKMHFLMPDYSRPQAMPAPFLEVTTWDRNSLSHDYRIGEEFYSAIRRQYWPIYLRQHLLGTAYLLLSPGTNYIQRFVDSKDLQEAGFGFIGQSDLGTKEKFFGFLKRSLSRPIPIIWTSSVLAFLVFYYLAVLSGLRDYWNDYRWHIWTLFVIGGGAFIFLLGPVGSCRYRFVLIQAFLPMAGLGILRWQRSWTERKTAAAG